MDVLMKDWNIRNPKLCITSSRLGEYDQLWQFMNRTIHTKRCVLGHDQTNHLVQNLSKLSSDNSSLNIAKDRLESDLQSLEKETVKLKQSNTDTVSYCDQVTFKVEILKARAQQYKEEIRAITEYTERLDKITTDCNTTQGDHKGNPSEQGNSTSIQLESKVVKDCTDLLRSFRSSNAQEDKKSQKEANWIKSECLLLDYSPLSIWKAFIVITEQSATKLKMLNETSLSKTIPSSKVQSIEKHIQDLQLQHIIQSQKLLSTRKQLKAMKQHQSNLTQLLKEMLVSKHPLVNKKLLFGWLESSLELTGLEKALRELNLVRDNMDRYSKERKAMTGMIEAKNTQILEFRDVVEDKQKQIRELVKHNAAAKERLKQQQVQTQKYMTQKLHPLDNMSITFINLKDHILKEVTLFTSNPNYGSTTHKPMINSSADSEESSSQDVAVTAVFKCPESTVIEHVNKLHTDKLVEFDLEEVSSEFHEMELKQMEQEETLGVLQECDAFVQQLEGPIYNRIETVLTAASKGIASLAEVESTLNEWWTQPAQGLVHWKTVEDMTVDQWVKQWQILATKYSTLQPTASRHK